MSFNMGNGNEAMRSILDYVLVLTVRLGAGSALVMLKNLWPLGREREKIFTLLRRRLP
jgi:hypothetical protein